MKGFKKRQADKGLNSRYKSPNCRSLKLQEFRKKDDTSNKPKLYQIKQEIELEHFKMFMKNPYERWKNEDDGRTPSTTTTTSSKSNNNNNNKSTAYLKSVNQTTINTFSHHHSNKNNNNNRNNNFKHHLIRKCSENLITTNNYSTTKYLRPKTPKPTTSVTETKDITNTSNFKSATTTLSSSSVFSSSYRLKCSKTTATTSNATTTTTTTTTSSVPSPSVFCIMLFVAVILIYSCPFSQAIRLTNSMTKSSSANKEQLYIGLIAPHTNFGKREYLRAIHTAVSGLNRTRGAKLTFFKDYQFEPRNIRFDMMSLTPSPTGK